MSLNPDIEFMKRQADIYTAAGLVDEAIDIYVLVIKRIKEDEEESQEEIELLENLGELRLKNADWNEGVETFKSLLQKKEHNKKGNSKGKENVHHNLGLLYMKRGDFEKGLQSLEKSLRISKSKNKTKLSAKNYLQMGELYSALGEVKEALIHLVEGLQSSRKTDDL